MSAKTERWNFQQQRGSKTLNDQMVRGSVQYIELVLSLEHFPLGLKGQQLVLIGTL